MAKKSKDEFQYFGCSPTEAIKMLHGGMPFGLVSESPKALRKRHRLLQRQMKMYSKKTAKEFRGL